MLCTLTVSRIHSRRWRFEQRISEEEMGEWQIASLEEKWHLASKNGLSSFGHRVHHVHTQCSFVWILGWSTSGGLSVTSPSQTRLAMFVTKTQVPPLFSGQRTL